MDTFNSDKCVDWPTDIGMWWFYGYRYGKISVGRECDRELVLCTVKKNASNRLMVTGNGQFVFESELENAKFIPATLPELPKEE